MEKWFSFQDKDIRWILRENLKKNRLDPNGSSLGSILAKTDSISIYHIYIDYR